MAKTYDVIVVGAGPAGLVAAKVAGENGLDVALLERKSNPTVIDKVCGGSLLSANEYFHHDLYRRNIRDKCICFPSHGFSVKYDGPYRDVYCSYFYSPNGYRMQAGVCEEQKRKGDYGKVTTRLDMEVLFRCLLEEVKAYSVDVLPGVNVEKVTTLANKVRVDGGGQSFEGRYLIAADGVNSRVAQVAGFNKARTYYCQLRAISNYMSGVGLPDPDATHTVFGFTKDGPAWSLVFPRPAEGEYTLVVLTIHPNVDLEAAESYFTKEAFCAPWFKNARKLRSFSVNENCYTPIVEPYKDRVLVIGDVGATQELEITGAMISGWKAGHAISLALQEENLGLEVTAIFQYVKWWQEAYINYYRPDTYMKNWALPYILTEPEEIDYLFSRIREPVRPCFNPYTMSKYLGQAIRKVLPIIEQERPEMLQKLRKRGLPFAEIIAEVTKLSKPVL